MSPIVTRELGAARLGAQLLDHRGGQLDAGHGNPACGEREPDPPGADGELERRSAGREPLEPVQDRRERLRREHGGAVVVVACGDLGAEVILVHDGADYVSLRAPPASQDPGSCDTFASWRRCR